MTSKNRTSKKVSSLPAIAEIVPAVESTETALAVGEPETETETVFPSETELAEIADFSDAIAEAISESETGTPAEEAPETFSPAVAAKGFAVVGERDEFGFSKSTETSFLLSAIRTGNYTRAELLSAFLTRFVGEGYATNPDETKRKKTSFSVFFSDVKRPIGTYHASRSLPIRVSDGTGKLSFSPTDLSRSIAAIAGGILSDLKGIKPKSPKYPAILRKYSLPVE